MTRFNDGEVSRRSFLGGSIAGLAAAGLPEWFATEAHAAEREAVAGRDRRYGPNDQINIAVIGPGGSKGGFRQGLGDTRGIASHPGVKCIAVCDLDRQHREEAAAIFGPDTAKYHDFRDVLNRKDIDAVVIGTPDHWHAIIASAAMRAGKDVYCEKPLTLTIDEGKRLVRTWKQTGRIFQVGSQQRSDHRFRLACELVRNGRLGKLHKVQANLPGGPTGGPFEVKPTPSKDDFDWDMWQGQTPETDYIPERTHGTFRHWLEYSGGMMTDWGAHHNDIAQWGLGTDRSGPIGVEAVGTRHFGHNCYNAFQEFQVTYTYPSDIQLVTSNTGENGVQFNGENGWIFVSRGDIRASDDRLLEDPLPANATRLYASDDHHGNFVDCVRSRKGTICDAEIGHRSVSVCHLGNICLRLGGRPLKWDPVREEFDGDREANGMVSRPMRNHWHVS
jgi:predicted dehydrogenase